MIRAKSIVFGCVALLLVVPATLSRGDVRFKNGTGVVPAQASVDAAATLVSLADPIGDTHVVVQFAEPVTDEIKGKMDQAGVSLLDPLGDNAFFARVSGRRVDAARLGQIATLSGASAVATEWKLHPMFLAGEIPTYAAVSPAPQMENGQPASEKDQALLVNPVVGAYLKFHPDVNLAMDGIPLAQKYGATVRDVLESINGLVIELPYQTIALLAVEDQVQWIEPPLPRMGEMNAENRLITGADVVQAAPYGLNGSGVTVLVYDGGTGRSTHLDFAGRHTNGDTASLSDHSTHVAGTIGGNGAASAGTERGMAPAVQIWGYGFEYDGTGTFLYTNPGDIEADYGDAINNHGADISNNSIGTNTEPNGFNCSFQGDYGLCSSVIDAIVRGSVSSGVPFRVVWANGNERQGDRCDVEGFGDYYSTAPPAGAKNHIAVGALNANDDSMTSFSSWGPVDDGRLKPDISAPGCEVGGDGGVRSCSSSADNAYSVKCGTSMASPTVCGLSALLLQDYRAHYIGEPDFRNSTLKILLAHTAVDRGNAGPDYQFGYGSVRIEPAILQMRSGNWLENQISQGETHSLLVVVNPGAPQMKVTLAWDDVPATPNANPVLVNDLDLVVFDPSNNQRFPWTLNPLNPSAPAIQTQADHINNIEQVVVDSPPPGVYRVEVRGFNVPSGPQPYSLTASPLLVNCSTQGVIALDRNKYACTSTATVRVVDCDLNTDDNIIDTVNVNIASDSEPAGETLLLTESDPATATFLGTINIDTVDSGGVLHVMHGDTVTVTYIDADDGMGGMNVSVIDTAAVDCLSPVISNVMVTGLAPRSATVGFDTDEPANGTIRYGLDCNALSSSQGSSGFTASHSIGLSGLTDNTTYYFVVDAVDEAGNMVTDDNGGACYSFTTPEVPDFFTELFDASDADLDNTSILFVPNGSNDFYLACATPIVQLPVDPAGGTNLTLTDDGNASVTISGGSSVFLYGTGYTSFFVNANGNITFGSSDSDYTPTFAEHFAKPRVAAVHDDLNPSQAGTVSWKQLGDRMVVTWLNVTEHNGGNQNTFQIELFFDGSIQISYLSIASTGYLAGLSAGTGLDPDFFESDLSALGDCGPRPPTAGNVTATAPEDTEITINLPATDDGTPSPLTYIVTSLPTYQLKDAGNDHLIVPGDLPYALVGGGNQVKYQPMGGYNGPDSFTYKANDGGVPPDGGDSNIGTVSITVVPVLDLPFFDDFPTTTFDSLKWALVSGATIDTASIAPPTAPNAARFNGDPTGGDEIRTHVINLSGETAVRLSYSYEQTGTGDSPEAGDDLFVEYQDATNAWQLLQTHVGADPDMSSFSTVSMLLPPQALHAAFRLRFRNTGTSGAFDDWFVDNVSVTVANAPEASNGTAAVAINSFTNITLNASDPNMDPLSYIIVSLPAHGVLKDPAGGDILGVPYTLIGGGNVVRYTPMMGYSGSDSFTFKANDGTYDSNVATVSIDVVPVLSLPFMDTFPTTTFDSSKWALVSNATIDTASLNPPSAPNAARFNGNPAGTDQIRTHVIDLSGESAVRLTYAYEKKGSGDSPEAGDDLFVEYLDAGNNWQILRQHLGSSADMTMFATETLLLPAPALHSAFRLRIRNIGTAGAFDDWFVDDVKLEPANAPSASNGATSTAENMFANITLVGSDPNMDPLTYEILSLPTSGQLRDPVTGNIGSAPHILAAGGNVVRYTPDLGFAGIDTFTFKVSDGQYDSNIATVTITVGGPQPVYTFNMDTNPGWTTTGQWAWGHPTGGGSHNLDPANGFTGTNVYGYNLAGDYPNNLSPVQYLTTTAMDFSSVQGAQLRFRRWLGVEQSTYDHANIDISTNGTAWTTVWNHTSTTAIADTSWSLQSYNISAIADGKPTVYIRWGMGTTDGSVTYPGWNIDDVEILGLTPGQCAGGTYGDVNLDASVNALDVQKFTNVLLNPGAAPVAEKCAADVHADGLIDMLDMDEFVELLLN